MPWPPQVRPIGGKTNDTPMLTDHPNEHNDIVSWIGDAEVEITAIGSDLSTRTDFAGAALEVDPFDSGTFEGSLRYAATGDRVVTVAFDLTCPTANVTGIAGIIPVGYRPTADLHAAATMVRPDNVAPLSIWVIIAAANGRINIQSPFEGATPIDSQILGHVTYVIGV